MIIDIKEGLEKTKVRYTSAMAGEWVFLPTENGEGLIVVDGEHIIFYSEKGFDENREVLVSMVMRIQNDHRAGNMNKKRYLEELNILNKIAMGVNE